MKKVCAKWQYFPFQKGDESEYAKASKM